jgi:hypothetical protein
MLNAFLTSAAGNLGLRVGEVQPSSASSSAGVGTQEPVGVGVREATSGSARMKGHAVAYQKAQTEILCQG